MMSKRIANLQLINITIVSLVLGFCIISLFMINGLSEKIFIDWATVPSSNWIRFGATMLLSAFLPGFFAFDSLNRQNTESPVRYFVFSYLLSVFLVTLSNVACLLIFGNWLSLSVLVFINCLFFSVWLVVKRGRINCNGVSLKFILPIICLVIFFVIVNSIHNFFIYGDQLDYHGWAVGWSENPFQVQHDVIYPSYPWWGFVYLLNLFGTSGLPSINTYVILIVMNMMPVLSFFCLVRARASMFVSGLAAFFAFFTAGLGWIYLPFIHAPSQVSTLQQLGWRTFDVSVPYSFLSITPDLSTSLILIGLPSLLAVLTLLIDSKKLGFQKRSCVLTIVLTALTFLSHVEAGVILTAFCVIFIVINYFNNKYLQFSFLTGLFLVLIVDFLVPAQYYSYISIGFMNQKLSLLLLSIISISASIIFSQFYKLNMYRRFKINVDSITHDFLSKLRSIDYTVFFSLKVVHSEIAPNNSKDTPSRFSLIALLIALLIVISYSVSILTYSVFFFPTFHFSMSVIPWFIYPVRFGATALLFLGFFLGCLFFKWHTTDKLPYALLLGIPLLFIIGHLGFYQQARILQYLPLLMAPFAAITSIRLVSFFQKKIHSKIYGRMIQVIALMLILAVSSSSMLLYLQYESSCQDPSHYSTLARRIPISTSIASTAEYLATHSTLNNEIATFPIGYGGAYSYIGGLTGRNTRDFLPIFAIKQPVNFFKVASDLQLKYVYTSSVEENLINEYYPDGFLHFYTSVASIAYKTNETKVYSIPAFYPPSENPDCFVLDMSAFTQSSDSQDSSFLSYITLASSGVKYAPSSYISNVISPNVKTIVLPIDPDISSIDKYLDWVNQGGTLIVFASNQLGTFSTFLGLNETDTATSVVNSIKTSDTTVSIPTIKIPSLTVKDPHVKVQAYYTEGSKEKTPFYMEKTLGNGTIELLYLSPVFSNTIESGNGSAESLVKIAPSIMSMIGFETDNLSSNSNIITPNYVLEAPTFEGNVAVSTNYLTFYAPTLTLNQPNSEPLYFEDASVEIIGSTKLSVNDVNGSISAGVPQDQTISPTTLYDDGTFWKPYLSSGKGVVGGVAFSQDKSVQIGNGSGSTKIVVEPGSRQNCGVYHDFNSVDWSSIQRISLYIYGSNTDAKVSLAVFSGTETASDVIMWTVTDNFTGWKKLTFDFSDSSQKGSNFNAADVKKLFVWFDKPGTWDIAALTLDVSGPTQPMPCLSLENELLDLDMIIQEGTQLVIKSSNQDLILLATRDQEFSLKGNPNQIYLEPFSTKLTIDGLTTFKGSYGYWLEQTPTVHDTITVSGSISFNPTFAESVTYVYAEDIGRNFVVQYFPNPLIYIDNLQITGKYIHSNEK